MPRSRTLAGKRPIERSSPRRRRKRRATCRRQMLKRSARKTTINSEVKDAGGEEAYRAHQAKRKAKRKAEEESKRKLHALEKEEAHARALLWLKQKNEQGEQDARDMVAKVLETLALPRMKEKCLDSIASGPPHVQGSSQVVRNYGKRKVKQGTRFYFVVTSLLHHAVEGPVADDRMSGRRAPCLVLSAAFLRGQRCHPQDPESYSRG